MIAEYRLISRYIALYRAISRNVAQYRALSRTLAPAAVTVTGQHFFVFRSRFPPPTRTFLALSAPRTAIGAAREGLA